MFTAATAVGGIFGILQVKFYILSDWSQAGRVYQTLLLKPVGDFGIVTFSPNEYIY